MVMTKARPTAASAAAMAMEKIATRTPVGGCGCGPKRQKAMKFKFAAASISSMPIKMKIAWRRLRAASRPIEKRAVETIRNSWRVGVMAYFCFWEAQAAGLEFAAACREHLFV